MMSGFHISMLYKGFLQISNFIRFQAGRAVLTINDGLSRFLVEPVSVKNTAKSFSASFSLGRKSVFAYPPLASGLFYFYHILPSDRDIEENILNMSMKKVCYAD